MKIMVTGSRHMAVCEHQGGDRSPCVEAMRHRHLMDRAMREHVHPLAMLAGGAGDTDLLVQHPFVGEPLELWHGDSYGADRLSESYWEAYRFGPVHPLPANWADLGSRAGHVRNGLLVAQMPEFVLAFPWQKGGEILSPGTRDAMHQAHEAGIPVYPYPFREVCPAIRRRR